MEVSYTPDPSGVSGQRMRLPPVSRRLKPDEVKLARGKADAMALRLRYHDESETHAKLGCRKVDARPRNVFDSHGAGRALRGDRLPRDDGRVGQSGRGDLSDRCERKGNSARMASDKDAPRSDGGRALGLAGARGADRQAAPAGFVRARSRRALWRDNAGGQNRARRSCRLADRQSRRSRTRIRLRCLGFDRRNGAMADMDLESGLDEETDSDDSPPDEDERRFARGTRQRGRIRRTSEHDRFAASNRSDDDASGDESSSRCHGSDDGGRGPSGLQDAESDDSPVAARARLSPAGPTTRAATRYDGRNTPERAAPTSPSPRPNSTRWSRRKSCAIRGRAVPASDAPGRSSWPAVKKCVIGRLANRLQRKPDGASSSGPGTFDLEEGHARHRAPGPRVVANPVLPLSPSSS